MIHSFYSVCTRCLSVYKTNWCFNLRDKKLLDKRIVEAFGIPVYSYTVKQRTDQSNSKPLADVDFYFFITTTTQDKLTRQDTGRIKIGINNEWIMLSDGNITGRNIPILKLSNSLIDFLPLLNNTIFPSIWTKISRAMCLILYSFFIRNTNSFLTISLKKNITDND